MFHYYHVCRWTQIPRPSPTPTKLVNLCDHSITLKDEQGKYHVIEPSGLIARAEFNPGYKYYLPGIPVPIISCLDWGHAYGIPAPQPNTLYLTSYIVAELAGRDDVVCPGTGHKDKPEFDREGKLVAVTRLVKREGVRT